MRKKNLWRGLLIGLFFVVLFSGFFGCKTQGKKKISRVVSRKAESVVNVKINPSGELNYLPGKLVFYFDRSFPGVKGTTISEKALVSYVKINPPIPASGRWINPRTFEVDFKKNPVPDSEYRIVLLSIPYPGKKIKLATREFSFKTPSLKLLNVSVTSTRRYSAEIELHFNFPVKRAGFEKFIRVFDAEGKEVQPTGIKIVSDNQIVYVDIPVSRVPAQFQIVLQKGLKSELGAVLKESITRELTVRFGRRPLVFRFSGVKEKGTGYIVKLRASSPGRRVKLINESVQTRVLVSPEMPFKVIAAGNLIYITGDFIPEKVYEITLLSGIEDKNGAVLEQDFKAYAKIPPRRGKLRFLYRGKYFGRQGEWKIPVKAEGLKTLQLSIDYMPPENVVFWYSNDYGDKDYIDQYSERIFSQKIALPSKGNLLWLNLKDYINADKDGIYSVVLSGETTNRRTIEDSIQLVVSDLSIIAKWYGGKLYVWTIDSATLKPQVATSIEVRTSKNFLLGTCATNSEGFCLIETDKKERSPYVIFARKANQWTYLHFNTSLLPMEAYDVSGEGRLQSYVGFIYPERNLYRPGEKINFAVLVREARTYRGLSIPVKLIVRDPRGNRFVTLNGKTGKDGLVQFSFPTASTSPTGKYALELYVGGKNIFTYFLFVETFVPERMSVDLKLPEQIDLRKSITAELEARYLFGAPASGENYTGWATAEAVYPQCSGYMGCSFGKVKRERGKTSWRVEIPEGELDSQGRARLSFSMKDARESSLPLRLTLRVEVSEGGSGRTTKKSISTLVHPKPFYIGLKPSSKRTISGNPVRIQGILLSPDCKPYSGKARLSYNIYNLLYYYTYSYYSDFGWERSVEKLPVVTDRNVEVRDGKFSFSFVPQSNYEDYLIEVIDRENGTISQTIVYGWGWGVSARPESPDVLPISVSRTEGDEGDRVTAEIKLPFEGKILWTVELDRVYSYTWREAKGKTASWTFKLPEGVPNVYVTALLIRSGKNYLVSRAFGVKRIKIRPKKLKLNVQIEAPQEIKPSREMEIRIKARKKFRATVAVVDEGILQITRFKTPDVYSGVLRAMRLFLRTSESFGWIVRKYMAQTGGGFAAKEEEFTQPRFAQVVSYWSGIVESDSRGVARIKFKVPEYQGKLRIMVGAVTPEALGSAEKYVIVKRDVYVSPTVPRFLSTEDRFSLPITLLNTTDRVKTVKLRISAEGATLTKKETLTLPPGERKILWVDGTAGGEPGTVKIWVHAETEGEKYSQDFSIPLYPSLPYVTDNQVVTLEGEGKLDLRPYFANWIPRAHRAKLIISPFPGASALAHISYLIHYPYGCIEQTSTSTLVLIRLAPLMPLVAPEKTKEEYINMTQYGISRMISMQTITGGFSFWPGSRTPARWSSAYATFVLLEAKSAGFSVPDSVIKAALYYLKSTRKKDGITFYVLARGGMFERDPNLKSELLMKARSKDLTREDVLWFAGVMNELGNKELARKLLDEALKMEIKKGRRLYHNFYSELKALALSLYIMESVNPFHPDEKRLVEDIVTRLTRRRSYYYTTQELAWSLLSLGLYMDKHGSVENFDVILRASNKMVKGEKGRGIVTYNLKNAALYDKLELEYKGKGTVYLTIQNTGFSRNQRSFSPYGSGFTIGREILTKDGGKTFRAIQGNMLVLRFWVNSEGYYRNAAIEIPVPAGLEIENPRLNPSLLPGWTRSLKTINPEYMDVRDDRVIVFTTLRKGLSYYYIMLRAVTPGEFFFPPARGILMYDPQKNANTVSNVFSVEKKKR